MEFFRRSADTCRGFVGVDVEAKEKRHLQWARIQVCPNEKRASGLLHVVVGSSKCLGGGLGKGREVERKFLVMQIK